VQSLYLSLALISYEEAYYDLPLQTKFPQCTHLAIQGDVFYGIPLPLLAKLAASCSNLRELAVKGINDTSFHWPGMAKDSLISLDDLDIKLPSSITSFRMDSFSVNLDWMQQQLWAFVPPTVDTFRLHSTIPWTMSSLIYMKRFRPDIGLLVRKLILHHASRDYNSGDEVLSRIPEYFPSLEEWECVLPQQHDRMVFEDRFHNLTTYRVHCDNFEAQLIGKKRNTADLGYLQIAFKQHSFPALKTLELVSCLNCPISALETAVAGRQLRKLCSWNQTELRFREGLKSLSHWDLQEREDWLDEDDDEGEERFSFNAHYPE
jgi:hypothetical protein